MALSHKSAGEGSDVAAKRRQGVRRSAVKLRSCTLARFWQERVLLARMLLSSLANPCKMEYAGAVVVIESAQRIAQGSRAHVAGRLQEKRLAATRSLR